MFSIFINCLARLAPALGGLISLICSVFLYEWQRLHGSKLTRECRATFNYKDLFAKDSNYIPYYGMGWLFGERYKGYVLPCTDGDDERTPNEYVI
ncbi:unnamed protein product [Heligmosomoides polygyrus]|uniref:Secreted protein n=1 Tax=Heligmosomoides polygyrus TaxID=6339 RepID=A0A183G8Q3_HELPZ|nr:unnamed protein product [Heligmosomoides polygyrus]